MNLKYLGKIELDQHMRSLFVREKDLLQDILFTIKEIDARKMYLDLGYPNLFSYLTEGVGYSEGSAQRRIDGARLLKELPEVSILIQSGEIKLSQVAMLQKAARQVLKTHNKKITSREKKDLINNLTNKNHSETKFEIARFFDLPPLHSTKKTKQSDGSIRLEITLSKELYEKIEMGQKLLSHSIPSGDLVQYLEYVTEMLLRTKIGIKSVASRDENVNSPLVGSGVNDAHKNQKPESQIMSLRLKSQSSKNNHRNLAVDIDSTSVAIAANSTFQLKSIPQKTKREILNKFKCCQYKDPITGKACRSQWFLQVDHRQPQWAGGNHHSKNLQILCGAHNRNKYLQESRRKLIS